MLYKIILQQYKQAPSWDNFFALLGALSRLYPELSKLPANKHRLTKLARRLGIEIKNACFEQTDGIVLDFATVKKAKPEGNESIDPGLIEEPTFTHLVKAKLQGLRGVIFLDRNLKGKRRLFTLAHELAHILLGHTYPDAKLEKWLEELHADVFAHWATHLPCYHRSTEENWMIAQIAGTKPLSFADIQKLIKEVIPC